MHVYVYTVKVLTSLFLVTIQSPKAGCTSKSGLTCIILWPESMTAIRRSVGKRSAEHDFNLILCQFLWMSESKDDSLGGRNRKGHPELSHSRRLCARSMHCPSLNVWNINVTYFQRLYTQIYTSWHLSMEADSFSDSQFHNKLYYQYNYSTSKSCNEWKAERRKYKMVFCFNGMQSSCRGFCNRFVQNLMIRVISPCF